MAPYYSTPLAPFVPASPAVGVYPLSCRTGSCIVGLAGDPEMKDGKLCTCYKISVAA